MQDRQVPRPPRRAGAWKGRGPGLGGAATAVPRKQRCPAGDIADRRWERASTTWLFSVTAVRSPSCPVSNDRDLAWHYRPHFAEEEAKVRVGGAIALRSGGGRSPGLERRQRRRGWPVAPAL